MESVLGADCRIPLIHMSKKEKYIEETNERMNEFFLRICVIQLYTNKQKFKIM